MKIPFGKFKNHMLDEVIVENEQYFLWVYTSDCDFIQAFPDLKSKLDEYFKDKIPMNYILKFGKYRGSSIQTVFKNNRGYIEYLKTDPFVKKRMKDLIYIIDKLENIEDLNF